ncbi:ABC transporter permease [Streptomyces sp. SID2888]|uniref:ABC transporter permease n=1 Tax=Streptomyces sp. SID2888 TaxID=2690256 RepID=UPI00136BBB01|nr:ABC transporter permease [Streptomyces sp. SID2888]MYV44993.1 ABC transporter permease [Streptomyces sp. SID2888]
MAEFLGDVRAIAGRHLRHLLRLPEKLIGFTVMPVAMVLGLGILFGGSMRVPGGGPYGAFVSAGVVTSIAVSTTAVSALGVVDDLQDGMFDRLRSLPVDRTAILLGRIVVDSLPVVAAMAGVVPAAWAAGWADGLRPTAALAAVGLELLLAMGCSCLGILLGLTVRNAEAVTSVVPVCLLPVTFLSNAFVPPDGLPGWLRELVGWNPVTAVNSAVRDLLGHQDTMVAAGFPDRHAAPLAIGFCALLIALAVPAAVRAHGRAGLLR